MLALVGFALTLACCVAAIAMLVHVVRHLRARQVQYHEAAHAPRAGGDSRVDWQSAWSRHWGRKVQQHVEREQRRWERHARRAEQRWGVRLTPHVQAAAAAATAAATAMARPRPEDQVLRAARRQARAEIGFYIHVMWYLAVVAILALINVLTMSHLRHPYPWFLWPAIGWGIGVGAHYLGTFGTRMLRERYFEPAIEREVRREKVAMQSEKQASIDELSSTIAHEIRNPIAAAKSLVQQMGEDPTSVENVDYAKVALGELDRVERRISHLLRYAKEEDYQFDHVNLAGIVDAALTQMRAKLDGAKVRVARNYIGGPTVHADKEKLQQVFTNVLDNAIDALDSVAEERRIDLFIENGGRHAIVRLRDNGCGIAPDNLERIFNPFFTTKEKGTGLGMAISRKIVEAHEGTIDVVSEPGRGTELAVTLPLPG